MKIITFTAFFICWLIFAGPVHAESIPLDPVAPGLQEQNEDNLLRESGYRSGRGSFSGGRAGNTPGARPGGTYNTVPRTPVTTQPGYRTGYPTRGGGIGSFFGGLAAGTLLGSLFHPFGWFGGGGYYGAPGLGMSFFGLLFWGVVLFFAIRWIIRWRNRVSR
ncbi:hypothetical protein [Paenibacillus cremeus]|uniref:Uncharacterized protein n=1 Tax=Paenibacillus cremeus TaxID=2163881 RepID=A0A559JVR8_9BACL|nr:hypothetical protein [Paenibacillus cremeus]TVY03981.1 hypothetical protein FPZ49_31140 [Paenibacillus cremeus]